MFDTLTDTLSERTRFILALAICAVASILVACAITAVTLAFDVHSCHTKGGHYSMDSHLTGTCSYGPEAGAL